MIEWLRQFARDVAEQLNHYLPFDSILQTAQRVIDNEEDDSDGQQLPR